MHHDQTGTRKSAPWVRLKLDAQSQGGGTILDVDGQSGGGSWKLDNFHGGHMYIVPYLKVTWCYFMLFKSSLLYFKKITQK